MTDFDGCHELFGSSFRVGQIISVQGRFELGENLQGLYPLRCQLQRKCANDDGN